jgi:hypothetical protein
MQDGEIIRNKRRLTSKKGLQKSRTNAGNSLKNKKTAIQRKKRSIQTGNSIADAFSIPAINVTLKIKKVPEWFDMIYAQRNYTLDHVISTILILNPEFEMSSKDAQLELVEQYDFYKSVFEDVYCDKQDTPKVTASNKSSFSSYYDFFWEDLILFKDDFSNDVLMLMMVELLSTICEPFNTLEHLEEEFDEMKMNEDPEESNDSYWDQLTEELNDVNSNIKSIVKRLREYDISIFEDIDWFITFFHSKDYTHTAYFLHKQRSVFEALSECEFDVFCLNQRFFGIVMSKDSNLTDYYKGYYDFAEPPEIEVSHTFYSNSPIAMPMGHVYADFILFNLIDKIYDDYKRVNPPRRDSDI